MSSAKEAFVAQQFVADEMRRILARQRELDPASYDYKQLMENLSVLSGSYEAYEDIEAYLQLADKGIVSIDICPGGVPVPEEEADAEDAVPVQEAEPAPAPKEEPPATPGKTYEMSDVRAALVNARRNGVNVTELLKEFGVENFSAFPAGRYGELMQRLGAA